MGSVGAPSERYEDVKGLVFGTARITKNFTDTDGYSNKKTVKGMLGELARAVDKYDKGEADYIRTMILSNEMNMAPSTGEQSYILEWEEVPNAGRFNANEEYESKDANYYVHIRFYHH